MTRASWSRGTTPTARRRPDARSAIRRRSAACGRAGRGAAARSATRHPGCEPAAGCSAATTAGSSERVARRSTREVTGARCRVDQQLRDHTPGVVGDDRGAVRRDLADHLGRRRRRAVSGSAAPPLVTGARECAPSGSTRNDAAVGIACSSSTTPATGRGWPAARAGTPGVAPGRTREPPSARASGVCTVIGDHLRPPNRDPGWRSRRRSRPDRGTGPRWSAENRLGRAPARPRDR